MAKQLDKIMAVMIAILFSAPSAFATTKGLSQIVTSDLQAEGDFSRCQQWFKARSVRLHSLHVQVTVWGKTQNLKEVAPAPAC